jgi:hypothetical protein
LIKSFPHFHRRAQKGACGNVENSRLMILFHISAKISTAFSTGVVENNSIADNTYPGFPHFHRPYYYY